MKDLDRKILTLKSERKSLREIGTILNISHEAVRKRLKDLANREKVSTAIEEQGLPADSVAGEIASSRSKPCKSRASEASRDGVNLIEIPTDVSDAPGMNVNHAQKPPGGSEKGKEKVSQEACARDLAGAIRQFLQESGVEVYEMTTSVEGFQARSGDKIVRFYVSTKSKQAKFNSNDDG